MAPPPITPFFFMCTSYVVYNFDFLRSIFFFLVLFPIGMEPICKISYTNVHGTNIGKKITSS